MNVRPSMQRFIETIEAYDIESTLGSMEDGIPYEIELEASESSNGKTVKYRFIHFGTTPLKLLDRVFVFDTDESVDTENGNFFINLGDGLVFVYDGVPYAIPLQYKSPEDIADVLPEKAGQVLKDVIRIAGIWKANGGGTFEELLARQIAKTQETPEEQELGDTPTVPEWEQSESEGNDPEVEN